MNRALCFFAFLFLVITTALAAPTVSLAWDPSPDADVNNYRLYWGPGSGNYTNSSDLGNVTNTVFTSLAPGGHYYFVVTAMNVGGAESDPSNEIDYLVPMKPASPTNFHFVIQASGDLVNWNSVTNVSVPITNAAAFFRVQVEPVGVTAPTTGLRAASVPSVPSPALATPVGRSVKKSSPTKAPFTGKRMKKPVTKPAAPPLPYRNGSL